MLALWSPPSPARSSAVISPCGRFRYRLERTWGAGLPLLFVMLNPSTADGMADDPTIRKCIGFARRAGRGGIIVENLFAFRATKPRDLARAGFPVGPENDSHLVRSAVDGGLVAVVAWGVQRGIEARARLVADLLRGAGCALKCYGLAAGGQPRHPLMLPYSTRVEAFEGLALVGDNGKEVVA